MSEPGLKAVGRKFNSWALMLTLGLVASSSHAGSTAAPAPHYAPVVILGGGISGLSALDELNQNGEGNAELYESTDRLGGRVWSEVDADTGVTINLGAELVDSTHSHMLRLLERAHIPVIERNTENFRRQNEFEYEGKIYTWAEVEARIFRENENAIRQMAQDSASIADEASRRVLKPGYDHTPTDVRLDNMSIAQYLDSIHAGKFLRAFLDSGPRSELGNEIDKLSARLLVDMVKVDPRTKTIQWLPHNDQKYVIQGGSQRLTDWLWKKARPSKLHTQNELISIHSDDAKRFTLVFKTPKGNHTVITDHLINTLPTHALRKVDIQVKGFSIAADRTIAETSYGTHTKLLMFFDERRWEKSGHSGDILTDQGFQIWHSSYGQNGKAGVLTAYFGEMIKTPEQIQAKTQLALNSMERIFPGIKKHFIKVVVKNWEKSYAYSPKPRHYFQEEDSRRENRISTGNMIAAGEHTDLVQNGYMDGAVNSGQHAAKQVLQALKTESASCFDGKIRREILASP